MGNNNFKEEIKIYGLENFLIYAIENSKYKRVKYCIDKKLNFDKKILNEKHLLFFAYENVEIYKEFENYKIFELIFNNIYYENIGEDYNKIVNIFKKHKELISCCSDPWHCDCRDINEKMIDLIVNINPKKLPFNIPPSYPIL